MSFSLTLLQSGLSVICKMEPDQKMWLEENRFVAPLFKGQRLSGAASAKWVNSKLKYPRKASADSSQGKVHVEFWLSEDVSANGFISVCHIRSYGGYLFL